MPVPSNIIDPITSEVARVTKFGQLAVAPLDFSTPVENDLTIVDTAANFAVPVAGQSVIITDVIVSTDRNVGVNGAEVEIYEASSATSIVVDKLILKLVMDKQSALPLTGLNFIVGPGVWINAKTDDNNVFLTIAAYRVPISE